LSRRTTLSRNGTLSCAVNAATQFIKDILFEHSAYSFSSVSKLVPAQVHHGALSFFVPFCCLRAMCEYVCVSYNPDIDFGLHLLTLWTSESAVIYFTAGGSLVVMAVFFFFFFFSYNMTKFPSFGRFEKTAISITIGRLRRSRSPKDWPEIELSRWPN